MIDISGHLKLCDFGLSTYSHHAHPALNRSLLSASVDSNSTQNEDEAISIMQKVFPSKPRDGRIKVLVLSKDPDYRFRRIIEKMRFTIMLTSDVDCAVQFIKNPIIGIDVIILDIDPEIELGTPKHVDRERYSKLSGFTEKLSLANSHKVPVLVYSSGYWFKKPEISCRIPKREMQHTRGAFSDWAFAV